MNLKTLGVAALLVVAGAGCTSFDVLGTRRYVDENNNYVTVEEGRDEEYHEFMTTLPNGKVVPDKTKFKIRLTLPDGRRYIMYQRLSPFGNLFKTDDEEWEYLVQGMECIICRRPNPGEKYLLSYRGTLCATERNPLNEKARKSLHRSSAPTGFKSTTGPSSSSSSSSTKSR